MDFRHADNPDPFSDMTRDRTRECRRCGAVLVDEDDLGWYSQVPATDPRIPAFTFMDRVHECHGMLHDVIARRDAPHYTDRELGMLREIAKASDILAEALGYRHDDQYGWATGDHTVVSLAMEVRNRGVKEQNHG